MRKVLLFVLSFIILATIIVVFFTLFDRSEEVEIINIGSFEECAGAGYPVAESYPRQCRVPDGRNFIEDIEEKLEKTIQKDCIVTGCSGQICAEEDIVTTCEYRDEYSCYKNEICERQQNENCGWTLTPQLAQCLGIAL